ncbi:MAG: DinB family protein [Acidobacteria bacterium]|nr:DinB family protein [Acidobacteriota bacterium]MCA1610244.1 DinB family protein [Acidobacteriota bacterium]
MKTGDVLRRLEAGWSEFENSYAGLSEADLLVPGVSGTWSVRDVIAHVSWWEEEALKHLPQIREGGRPPRYSVRYGGIDAFNALMTEGRKHLPLAEILFRHRETHERLIAYVRGAPEDLFTKETRFRRRLRLDAWGHYPLHATAIVRWRDRLPAPRGGGGDGVR